MTVTPRSVAKTSFLALVAVAPLLSGGYWLGLATVMVLYALAATGLDLTFGRAGLLSVGHAAFFGIGAYAVAMIGARTDLPGLALLVIGVALTAVAGVVVGAISLRVAGFYFALLTLATAIILETIVRGVDSTGGPSGISGVSRNLLGTGELTRGAMYLLAVVILGLVIAALRALRHSRTGRALEALRTQPTTAASCGVDVYRLQLTAFTAGAALAGLAGGLFAQTLRYISPEFVGLKQSVEFLIMTVIGGLGTIWGVIPGVLVVRGLPEYVQALRDWQLLILGLLTLLVLVRFRLGIAGTIEQLIDRRGRQADTPVGATQPVEPAIAPQPPQPTSSPPTSAAAQPPVLQLAGVSRRFGGLVAVESVDLEARPGEIHALVGPNGAGKTTVVNCITGVDQPTEGSIVFDGQDITRTASHERARLGMARTFQLVGLAEGMSVLDNVLLGTYAATSGGFLQGMLAPRRRAEEQRARAEAEEVLDRLGLSSIAGLRPTEISIGQRRLVEVARCLVGRPSLILLDEPAAGLNETETQSLGARLREIRDSGTAIVLIEHDMPLVMDISDRITVLNFGVRIAVGDPREVATSPEVIKAYLGEDVGETAVDQAAPGADSAAPNPARGTR